VLMGLSLLSVAAVSHQTGLPSAASFLFSDCSKAASFSFHTPKRLVEIGIYHLSAARPI
jgi:hypothetical protein